MITLAEIESAVRQLPLSEQKQLLQHLQSWVPPQSGHSSQSRRQWMDRLSHLRGEIGTGRQTLSGEQIVSDSREERA